MSTAPPARVPFGYAQARPLEGDHLLSSTTRLSLVFGSLVLAVDQLFIVQPKLYLELFGHAPTYGFRLLAAVGLTVGFLGARRWPNPVPSPAPSLLVAAWLVALSGPARFFAFDGSLASVYSANLIALLAVTALGVALARVLPHANVWLRLRDGTLAALHPLALTGFVLGLVTAAVLTNAIGPLRSSITVGGGLSAAALLTHFDLTASRTRRFTLGVGFATFLAFGLGALAIEAVCPLRRVLASTHPLVYTASTERTSLDFTVGQGGLHYFVNGELRFSAIDEGRWSNALVGPAMARVNDPKTALVLSLGEGLLERELLSAAPQLRITSVVRDRRLAASVARQPYLRRLTHESLRSPQVHLVERDPAVFALGLKQERFDVILVDLPDPSGVFEAKYYTRLFYRALATHLSDRGVLTVQAASARRSPRSFAVIGATLEAAGLHATPMMVPLIARGEWSLYVCSHGPLPEVLERARYEQTFAGSLETQLMSPWPDTLPPKDFVAKPSTLHDSVILEWFEIEAEDPNHG